MKNFSELYSSYAVNEDVSTNSLSLYDLMAAGHYLFLKKNDKFGYNLEILGEDGKTLVNEKGVHEYAVDELAAFCKNCLSQYTKITGEYSRVLTLFVGKMLDGWICYISSDTIQGLVAMAHTHLPSELEARAEGTIVLAQLEAALANND